MANGDNKLLEFLKTVDCDTFDDMSSQAGYPWCGYDWVEVEPALRAVALMIEQGLFATKEEETG